MSKFTGDVGGYIARVETKVPNNGGDQYLDISIAHDQGKRNQNGDKNTVWIKVLVFGNRVPGLSNLLAKGDYVTASGPQTVEVYFNESKNMWIPQITLKAFEFDFAKPQGQGQGQGNNQQRQNGNQQQNRGQQQGGQRQQGQQGQQGNGQQRTQGNGQQQNNQRQGQPQRQQQQPQRQMPPPPEDMGDGDSNTDDDIPF